MKHFVTNHKYLLLIFFIGFITYFPIFFNGFVWDDKIFIINNPQVHSFNLAKLFGPSMFNVAPFYRPLPAVYFASIYSLFGQQAFFYHVLQLFFHISCTFLLFIFFRIFLKNSIALFLSLIFLVHPINVESVAFIGSTTSQLYFLPGIIALILATKEDLSPARMLVITGFLLISTLAKETGFLFIFLTIAYRYIFGLNKLKQIFISAAGIIGVYFILRMLVGGAVYTTMSSVPIGALTFTQRLINVPAIFSYYLKTFIFPRDLLVWQTWVIKTVTIENVVIPLILSCVFFILIFLALYLLIKKDHTRLLQQPLKQSNKNKKQITGQIYSKQFIFFLFWFLIGMVLILQLVPLDSTVADRWFYFPLVGLLGLIGVMLQIFRNHFKHHKNIYITVLVIIVCLLSTRTFIRTLDWKDNITLYGHDVKAGSDDPTMIYNLAVNLYNEGRINEAFDYARQSYSLSPSMANLGLLGTIYQTNKQYAKAISTYNSAITLYNSIPKSDAKPPPGMVSQEDALLEQVFVSLSSTYLSMNKPDYTIKLIKETALKKFPSGPRLYYYLARAEYQKQNIQNAIEALEQSYTLYPIGSTKKLIFRLQNNLSWDGEPY